MSRLELLNSRGFKDEKHLSEFLKNCADETWKKELMDFFGKKEVEEKPKKSKGKKEVEEVIETTSEEITEEVEEVIETTPEEITEEVEKELTEEFPEIEENKED